MKIMMDSAAAGYLNKINNNAKNKQQPVAGETGRNFDQLVISSNSRQAVEAQLETAAKKEVTSSVFQQNPSEKIAALKEQISQGMYKIDPEAIASRILLLGGDE